LLQTGFIVLAVFSNSGNDLSKYLLPAVFFQLAMNLFYFVFDVIAHLKIINAKDYTFC